MHFVCYILSLQNTFGCPLKRIFFILHFSWAFFIRFPLNPRIDYANRETKQKVIPRINTTIDSTFLWTIRFSYTTWFLSSRYCTVWTWFLSFFILFKMMINASDQGQVNYLIDQASIYHRQFKHSSHNRSKNILSFIQNFNWKLSSVLSFPHKVCTQRIWFKDSTKKKNSFYSMKKRLKNNSFNLNRS